MSSENNKRIAKNTIMLYLRQVLILLVSLYTVRVVLNVLGNEDYGLYSVVGGIVTLFSFLSGTMASATQRFFSFALGENDKFKLKKIFSVNLLIYLSIAIFAVILLESIGLWYIKNKLEIPNERYNSVIFLFHFSVFTFVINILYTPYNALIIAHEDMQLFAYISIFEAILKLIVVFLLTYIALDKLEIYGVLLFFVGLFISIIYLSICLIRYDECQFKKLHWDKSLFNEILNFTGWTLFGQISVVFRNQAITVLLNQVFNPVIVAARAIAVNITMYINVFASNFNIGLYPPIIKSYASGEKNQMYSLIYTGSKITFFLLWVIGLPFYLEMNTILNLWLKNPPLEAILFTKLALIEVIINSVSQPIVTAARAPGKMKNYELSLGMINIGIFIASWIWLRIGGEAYSVFIIAIIANIIMFFLRLILVKYLIGFELKPFFIKVIFPTLLVIALTYIPTFLMHNLLPKKLAFSFITILISIILTCIITYWISFDCREKKIIQNLLMNRLKKLIIK